MISFYSANKSWHFVKKKEQPFVCSFKSFFSRGGDYFCLFSHICLAIE